MRVITGTARGKRLKELPGIHTRPTTDRVKESIFNILQFEIEGRRVLDLFAGTGQLGIEALSRGAAHADFVDADRTAAAVIRENLNRTDLAGRATVVQRDAAAFLSSCRAGYDVVFLDPPYDGGLLEKTLETVTRIDILRAHGIIICESAAETNLPLLKAPYAFGREYQYGRIKLTTYRRQECDAAL